MKRLFKFLLVFSPVIILAQNASSIFKVSYDQYENGKKTNNELAIFYKDEMVFLSKPEDKIKHYIDFRNNQNISMITHNDENFKSLIPFDALPKPSVGEKKETILDYDCEYVSFSYFSNKIEVWYTDETEAKGSPYSRFLPDGNVLVLKIRVNGNREIIANSIVKENEYTPSSALMETAKKVSKAEFEEIKINSRYRRLQVFENDTINFDPKIKIPEAKSLIGSKTYHFSKGSVIMKRVSLSQELRNSGYVFAKLNCKSNGDAYDRTGSVFMVPVQDDKLSVLDAYLNGLESLPVFTDNNGQEYQGITKEENYVPPTEILRFYTSFGADYFNDKREINNYDWANDVTYKQEVSALIPSEVEEIWVGVFVGNYDSGGHIVSLELDFYPGFNDGKEIKSKKYIDPLFSTVNTLEMSGQNYGRLFKNDTLKVEFEIPDNVENLQLLYTTTGHGGWGEGDEFNPRLNKLYVDGKEIFKIVPWRTDCASYRLSNPASGNFGNGLSSSDLSRSNWCPATLTPPYGIPLSTLKKGKHTLEVVIDQGNDEGSSTNHWNVTGVLIGDEKSKK